jgi:hypothetical protein
MPAADTPFDESGDNTTVRAIADRRKVEDHEQGFAYSLDQAHDVGLYGSKSKRNRGNVHPIFESVFNGPSPKKFHLIRHYAVLKPPASYSEFNLRTRIET